MDRVIYVVKINFILKNIVIKRKSTYNYNKFMVKFTI